MLPKILSVVVLILCVLMVIGICVLLQSLRAQATTVFENVVEKATGDTIHISWEYPTNNVDGFAIYRRIGQTGSLSKIASLAATIRSFDYTMPSGTTKQYRFSVMVVKNGEVSPAGFEVVVNRKSK